MLNHWSKLKKEAQLVIDEEVDKVLNHIQAKLPPEVLEKLDVMGSVKSRVSEYVKSLSCHYGR